MSTVVNIHTPQPAARAAFEHAARLAPQLAQTGAAQRIELMQRLVRAMMAHRQDIYQAVRQERGLAPVDVDGELLMVKFEADFIAAHLHQWMQDRPAQPSLMTLGKKCYVHYEPKGVVLHLATWNAPYVIGFLPVLGALAAGNAVVLKPSELAPQSSAVIAKIVAEAFPQGELAVVEGGAETAQQLLACPFNHVFYVGNSQIGRLVMKAAADHCASVTLEMGGKNPSIVGPSADLADTAMKTAWGRMCNGGQACISPDYVLVHESVAAPFTEALVREFAAQYNADGKGYAQNPDYPVIINERHFNRVRGLIEDARTKGAKVVCGGQYLPERRLIEPTVLAEVRDDMRVMQEEIFGPVICVVPYREREEAASAIAGRDKPLALYVFSKDRAEIDWFLAHTTAGSSVVNHNVVQSGTNPHLPFGGVNTSGIGRMVGWHTFNECSNARSVVEDGPALGDPRMYVPPLTDKYKKQLAGLLTQKPVPQAVVGLIHGVLRLKARFSK
ncbi:MAG: aldehyde dehydrogenase family protein [Nevskia sp.]|nr:aldehyde dehydrogenase family protein [Nevskia sp.]